VQARKRKRPHEAGVCFVAVLPLELGAFPGNPRDVRPGNAKLRQLAIAEIRQILQALATDSPGPQKPYDVHKHISVPISV
jgi:hypothetical protein